MLKQFFLGKFSEIGKAYSTQEELMDHLCSGEVSVNMATVIKYLEEYEARQLTPAKFQVHDKVELDFYNGARVKDCQITAVHFYHNHVKYDVSVNYKTWSSRLYNVDSVCVFPPDSEGQPQTFEPYSNVLV
jgi:hypothetical protein